MNFYKLNRVTLLVLFIGVTLFSCSEEVNSKKKKGMQIDDDLYAFSMIDLSGYELPATIYLPDETADIGAAKPMISHITGDFQWNISVGPSFNLTITDCGSKGINRITREKKDLKNISNFSIDYLIDTTDLLIYKRTLIVDGVKQASPKVGVKHVSYHVFGLRKIDKYYYSFSSQADGCSKEIAELMAKSIRSVQNKNKSKKK